MKEFKLDNERIIELLKSGALKIDESSEAIHEFKAWKNAGTEPKKYYRFMVVLHTPYQWGGGYSESEATLFTRLTHQIAEKIGLYIQTKDGWGSCESMFNPNDKMEEIYCHPMDYSGTASEELIHKLEEACKEILVEPYGYSRTNNLGEVKDYCSEHEVIADLVKHEKEIFVERKHSDRWVAMNEKSKYVPVKEYNFIGRTSAFFHGLEECVVQFLNETACRLGQWKDLPDMSDGLVQDHDYTNWLIKHEDAIKELVKGKTITEVEGLTYKVGELLQFSDKQIEQKGKMIRRFCVECYYRQ